MSNDERTLSSRRWRFLAFRHFAVWGIVATLFWIVALIAFLKQPVAKRELPTACIIGAIAATVICVVNGTYKIRRAVYLFHHGIEVEGTITSFGWLRMHGSVRVNCSYQVNGTTYTTAWSGPAELYDLDDKVALIVDPKRPAVCEEKANIYHEHRDPLLDKPDTWKWWYYILAGIGFAAAAIHSWINPNFLKPREGEHGHFADLYNFVGPWGVIALFAALSLSLFWIGISEFEKRRR